MEIDLLGSEKSKLDEHIEKKLLEDRNIYITEDISSFMFDEIIKKIHYINLIDEESGKSEDQLPPLKVHIDSYGGEVHSGWSIIGALREAKCPVWTYVRGYAMSMSLAIFSVGDRRFLSKHGTLMFHELSSQISGNSEEIKRATKEYERLQSMYNALLIEKTDLTEEELIDHQDRVSDWYIDSELALSKNIATDIL